MAEDHRRWWRRDLQGLPTTNIVVQPRNRGTANGILLQILHVAKLDPQAEVVLLPSDHFVVAEDVLAHAIRQALVHVRTAPRQVILMGMVPGSPDPDLGYILPGSPDGQGTLAVQCFVEKPARADAEALVERGALWNAFILVASCGALLDLFSRAMPDVFTSMRDCLNCGRNRSLALSSLYQRLPVSDFSCHVLMRTEWPVLRVAPVPECGWSDLGTPARLGHALARGPRLGRDKPQGSARVAASLDLAVNYQRAMSVAAVDVHACDTWPPALAHHRLHDAALARPRET